MDTIGLRHMIHPVSVPPPDEKVPISEDAHVRSGSYADTNYGFSTLLEVKDAPNATGADFDRISYLKGDLGGYPGTSTLSAALYFHVNTDVSDPAVPFVPVTVKGLTDNRWSENTVTSNSRPGSSGETILGNGEGQQGRMVPNRRDRLYQPENGRPKGHLPVVR